MLKPTRGRVLTGIVLLLIAATVASLTVGRDIYAGRTPGIDSFILVHFAGYLFFIVMPVEVLVPWYLAEGHPGAVLLVLAVATALAAQIIDFGIGRLLSGRIVEHVIGERRLQRARSLIDRYGGGTIFFFNLFPLSSPSVLAAAGIVRFPPLRAMLWSGAGLTLKYAALVWLFRGGS